jgi:hypothetical protein
MKTILCSLLSKFKFELDESMQDPEELKMWRLVLRPRDGISLKTSPLWWRDYVVLKNRMSNRSSVCVVTSAIEI